MRPSNVLRSFVTVTAFLGGCAADPDAPGITAGKAFTSKVPLKPFTLLADVGDKCADDNAHIALDQSVYWYRWQADRAGCKAVTQNLKVTVSKLLSSTAPARAVYPEYDRL